MNMYTCKCGSKEVSIEYSALVSFVFNDDGTLSDISLAGVLGGTPTAVYCFECGKYEVSKRALDVASDCATAAAKSAGMEVDLEAGTYLYRA